MAINKFKVNTNLSDNQLSAGSFGAAGDPGVHVRARESMRKLSNLQ